MKRQPGVFVVVLLAALTVLVVGCGSSSLAAGSTCEDFMSASPEEQAEVISKLSSDFDTPETATPLGSPNVAYVCSSEPEMTLEEYFVRAHESEGG
jgi:hypothetical protein